MSSDIDPIRARKPRALQLATAITTKMSDVLLAKHNLSIFAAAFAVNAFACLPLIFVNRPLLDDMGRSLVGYLDWTVLKTPPCLDGPAIVYLVHVAVRCYRGDGVVNPSLAGTARAGTFFPVVNDTDQCQKET
jgi:hypothetical protein